MLIRKMMLIRPGVRFSGKRFAPPLGLLYLVSVLRQQFPGQFKIELVDQALYNLNFEQMRERIKNFNPDLVGFSCLSVEDDEMSRLSRIVKELNPQCKTILGGPHASVFYDHILEKSQIDVVVIGEGEVTLPELIQNLQKDQPIDNVKGIAFKKNGKLVLTPAREPIEDLDNLPFPAWDMVDFKKYSREPGPNVYYHSRPWTIFFTSRGCPFRCAYCHNVFGKEKVRYRSLKSIFEEIKILTQIYGVKELQIIDDNFNYDSARVKQFCEIIIKKGIKIKLAFPNGLRADLINEEIIHKLKEAGCYVITYAVDTASLRLQKLTQKNLNFDKTRQAIEWANKEQLITHVYFMLGLPGETLEEINSTIKYAIEFPILIAFFLTAVVYPHSELMRLAQQFYPNFILKEFEMSGLHYRAEKPFYSQVTGMDLAKIQAEAYRRFFFRPRIILGILFKLPKNAFFFKSIWRGFELSLLWKFKK